MELWIARDVDGCIYVHKSKPIRDGEIFYSPEFDLIEDCWRLPDDYYPEVTWENSPQRLVLNNEKQ